MLPININMQDFMLAGKKEAEKIEKQEKKKKVSCSQQALANQLVIGSMPNNPNAQPMQQAPAQQ